MRGSRGLAARASASDCQTLKTKIAELVVTDIPPIPTDIPPIPIEKLKLIRIDDEQNIGKLVQILEPIRGESCTAMITRSPGENSALGAAYFTGTCAGAAHFFNGENPPSTVGVDVSDLAEISVTEVKPVVSDSRKPLLIKSGISSGSDNFIVSMALHGMPDKLATMIVSRTHAGNFVAAGSIVTIGTLHVSWRKLLNP